MKGLLRHSNAFQKLQVTLLVAGSMWSATPALSQLPASSQFPTKPVTIVSSAAPGGGVDFITRAVAKGLSEEWGQPVIVDNKAGAGGMIGTELVSKAAPDGYTLLTVSLGHATNPSLYRKMAYDTLKDFSEISLLAKLPVVLVVNKDLPFDSVRDVIAYAKANPGKLNCGSGGNGSSQHLSCELFKSLAQVQIQHVPYRGVAAAGVDVIGGQIEMMFDQISFAEKNARAGRLKALAVTTPERSPLMPELPTMDEAGVPGYSAVTWFGLLGPAGMAKALQERIAADVARVMTKPAAREALASQNFDLVFSTPEEFDRFLREEMAKWDKVIKAADVRAD